MANLASPLSTLITGPLLARALGPDGRGLAAALFAPLALASLMFTLGLPDALTYFVASARLTGPKANQIALSGGLVCSIVACLTLLLSAHYLFRAQPQALPDFELLLLTLPPTLVFLAIRGIAQGRQQFNSINKERISAALLRLLGLGALALIHSLTPVNSVWVTIISGLVGALFLLPALRGHTFARSDKDIVSSVARYAVVVALGTFGGLIVIRLDQVLMVSLTSRAELAFYAVAASLAELPLAVVTACHDLAFTLSAERGDPRITARLCRLTLLAVGMTCLAGGLLTPIALPLLFGKSFKPAVFMAEILLVATVGRAITSVIGAGLMTNGKMWGRSVIQLGGAALTAVLIFAFVPGWGGSGAALVTMLTYAALAAASLFVFIRSCASSLKECLMPTRADVHDLYLGFKAILKREKQTA